MSAHLFFRMAQLLRAADESPTNILVDADFRAQAEAALKEFEAKGYAEDEPIFLLRGRDQLAADAVRHWGARASVAGVNGDKVVEALEIASAMERFSPRRLPD